VHGLDLISGAPRGAGCTPVIARPGLPRDL